MKAKKAIALFALFAAGAAVATPAVSNVSVSHNPAKRTLIVKYDLSDEAIVTLDVKTNGVSIGSTGLRTTSGDVNRKIAAGSGKTICWCAERGLPGVNLGSGVSVDVKAWTADDPPKYMAVDLTGTNGVPVGFKYYCDDLDVTSRVYKTDYLVFRYIPAKDVLAPMGLWRYQRYNDDGWYTYHRVKLTNDFYMAVYELTQGQFRNVWKGDVWLSSFPDDPVRPVDSYVQRNFRSNTKVWPDDGHEVGEESMMHYFRTVLGLPTLDFPTEAEWEFACRAGVSLEYDPWESHRYDGSRVDEALSDDIAWSSNNTPVYDERRRPQEVGLKTPNPFGLYDMLGNVWEVCLDYLNEWDKDSIGIDDSSWNNSRLQIAPTGGDSDFQGKKSSTDPSAMHTLRGASVDDGQRGVTWYVRNGMPMNTDLDKETGKVVAFGYRLVCLP